MPCRRREAAAGPALGDGGEDQRVTVEPVDVVFEHHHGVGAGPHGGSTPSGCERRRSMRWRCETENSPQRNLVQKPNRPMSS